MTIKIDGTEKKLIVDTESPVTIIPPDKEIMKDKKILLVTRKHQDVDKNEVEFTGKITVEAQGRGIRRNLSMLIAESENIKPLLGKEYTIYTN